MIVIAAAKASPSPSPLPTATATPVPSPNPTANPDRCALIYSGLATIAIDPANALTMRPTQTLIIALKANEDGGFMWHVRGVPVPSGAAAAPLVKFENMQSIADTAFAKLSRPASAKPQPAIVGGLATEYFAFTAQQVGKATIVLDLFGPGNAKPSETKTFRVDVEPNRRTC